MGASDGEAWGIVCRHCDAQVARHSQLAFLLENATGVHLTLIKSFLTEEPRETGNQETDESWILRSRENVAPKLHFIKIRTQNAFKRDRMPFELLCSNCQTKVGSEGFLDEFPVSLLLLNSKDCIIVLDKQPRFGGIRGRKWGAILPQLRELAMPLKTQLLKELLESRVSEEEVEEPVIPVVLPTVETIKSHFTPSGRMSKLRQYQVELTLSALLENTIVYLPTGCGKTLVAIKVMEEMKHLNPNKLVVFFVPTGPLVSQQAAYIRRESDFQVAEMSGQRGRGSVATTPVIDVNGDKNALVVTPQNFLNLLFNNRTKITDYSVMIFDEAHHATGSHPYCDLLKQLATIDARNRPHILALTASPFGEAVRETSGKMALEKLAKVFNGVINTPTIAAADLEGSFIPKEAKWMTVNETEEERRLRGGLKHYIQSFYAQISNLMSGQVMPFETNYDTNDMELSQFMAKLRLLQGQARKRIRDNNDEVELNGAEESARLPSDLELILKHLLKVASSFYNLSIHGAGSVAEALVCVFNDLKVSRSPKGARTLKLVESSFNAILHPALTSFPVESFGGASISNRVHMVADCIRNSRFTHESRAIVFVRRRKTAILLAKAME